MLNVSFSVWMIPTNILSFELGVIEDDPDSVLNPPDINGPWRVDLDGQFYDFELLHERVSDDFEPHYIHLQWRFGQSNWNDYSGYIDVFDDSQNAFKLKLHLETSEEIFSNKTIIGWLNKQGNQITWTDLDENNNIISSGVEFPFNDKVFTWNGEEPKARGCYNWGPLTQYEDSSLEEACGIPPELCAYDGLDLNCTAEDQAYIDNQTLLATTACFECDIRDRWDEYDRCSNNFKSMQTKSSWCGTLTGNSGLGTLDNIASKICTSAIQMCTKFRSVSFTKTNIEICPQPELKFVDLADSDGDIDFIDVPDANPVIFACIDFAVTNGIVNDLGPQQKEIFEAAVPRM